MYIFHSPKHGYIRTGKSLHKYVWCSPYGPQVSRRSNDEHIDIFIKEFSKKIGSARVFATTKMFNEYKKYIPDLIIISI